MANGTIIDSEGFGFSTSFADFVNYARWAVAFNSSGGNIGSGLAFGDPYLHLPSSGTYKVYRTLPSTTNKIDFCCRISPALYTIVALCDAFENIQVAFVFNNVSQNGIIQVFSGGQWTGGNPPTGTNFLGQTAVNSFNPNAEFHFEAQVICSTSAGYVQVWVNGTSVALSPTLANVNTAQGNASNPIAIIGFYGGYGGLNDSYFQHIAVNDETAQTGNPPWTDRFGQVRVQTIKPTGAGSNTAFTPTGLATNWQNAANVPPNVGVDYNSDSSVGAIDSFAISGLDPTFSTIRAVNVKSLCNLGVSGSRSMASIVDSSGTIAVGTPVAISTGPIQIQFIEPTDPATGAAWTTGGVAAMQPGYKVTA